jgi:hypothetical protein
MNRLVSLASMAAMACPTLTAAATLAGSYVAEEESAVTLTLREGPDGAVSGTLDQAGESVALSGRRAGEEVAGQASAQGTTLPFSVTRSGERLVLEIGAPGEGEQLTFRPAGAARAQSAPGAAARAKRNVVINGQRLDEAEIGRVEAAYRIRIPDADYWYDPLLGAWGPRGGPTMGFIAPGLTLGGRLQPDASGRGTNVFVNGREIHPYDLAALQSIAGPILPGRYFITAQGMAGPEGGPPMWNLAALAAARTQVGGSNTWQGRVTASSGFSDGTTGAVFLPNGGIVSTGQ